MYQIPPAPSFVPPNDWAKYASLFTQEVGKVNDRISAAQAQPILSRSNLPKPILAKIWSLTDTSCSGSLTFPEFAVALHLAKSALSNPQSIPDTLPPLIQNELFSMSTAILAHPYNPPPQPSSHLSYPIITINHPTQNSQYSTPPTNSLAFSAMTVPGIMPFLPPIGSDPVPLHADNSDLPSSRWILSPDEKLKYASLFKSWDSQKIRYLSGDQCREIFSTSELPTNILQHIWTLSDIHNAGKLNIDEFAIAMHLIYKKLNNVDLPTKLPIELIPSSTKDLDSSVVFMKDQLLLKIHADKIATANSPSWMHNNRFKRPATIDSPTTQSSEDSVGYVSRNRRRPQPASSAITSTTNDSSDKDLVQELTRQIDQTRELISLKREQYYRSHIAQGQIEDADQVREAHSKVIKLQDSLQNLKYQFGKKLDFSNVDLYFQSPVPQSTKDTINTILETRKRLNDTLLSLFKARDIKKYKYLPIPESKSLNLSSILPDSTPSSSTASPALSNEERRRQKAAQLLAQRMAALDVSQFAPAPVLSDQQKSAKDRIQAEEDRLSAIYKELESNLKSLVDPDAAKILINQFIMKMSLVDEFVRPVDLPDVYKTTHSGSSNRPPNPILKDNASDMANTVSLPKSNPFTSTYSSDDESSKPKAKNTAGPQFDPKTLWHTASNPSPPGNPVSAPPNILPLAMDPLAHVNDSALETLQKPSRHVVSTQLPPVDLLSASNVPIAVNKPPYVPKNDLATELLQKTSNTGLTSLSLVNQPNSVGARRMSTDWLSEPVGGTITAPFKMANYQKPTSQLSPSSSFAGSPDVMPTFDMYSPNAVSPKALSVHTTNSTSVATTKSVSPSVATAKSLTPQSKHTSSAGSPVSTSGKTNPFLTSEENLNAEQPASPPKELIPSGSPLDPFSDATAVKATSSQGMTNPVSLDLNFDPFKAFQSANPVASSGDPSPSDSVSPLYNASVLYDYTPTAPDDLAVKVGQIVSVLESDDDWSRVKVTGTSTEGYVPTSYLRNLASMLAAKPTPGSSGYMLYPYKAVEEDELTVDEDMAVDIIDTMDPDWWLVQCAEKRGLVPASYVQLEASNKSPKTQLGPVEDPFSDHKNTQSPMTLVVQPTSPTSTIPSIPQSPDDEWLAVPSLRHKSSNQSLESHNDTWATTMYPKLVESLSPEERKRQEVIYELIKTEQAYVRDLQVVADVFIAPLASDSLGKDILGSNAASVLQQIFGNWEEILVTNVTFLSDLELKQEQDDGLVDTPGQLILEHLPAMKCYTSFCVSQKSAVETIVRLKRENPKFNRFLTEIKADPRCRALDLASYLLKPMQRLTRYPLFIKQAIHHTPETHSDHTKLVSALQLGERILNDVNEAARDEEDRNKFNEIFSKVDLRVGDTTLNLQSATRFLGKRHFVHEGRLVKAKSGREVYGYLFNDILLLCKSRQSDRGMPFSVYRDPLPLEKVRVERDAEHSDVLTIHINDMDEANKAGSKLVFKCSDSSSRNHWANKLDTATAVAHSAVSKTDKPTSPTSAIGTLQVTVLEGIHFRPVDSSITRLCLQCELSLNANETQRTRIIRNTTHPVFNQTLTLSVQSLDHTLRIVVFNSPDKFSADYFMGSADLPLHILEYFSDNETLQELPLQHVPPGPIIRIKLQFRSLSRQK